MSIDAPVTTLGRKWRAPAQAAFDRTSFGLSGGRWVLPVNQRLVVPPLDHMRVIVNLSPLVRHEFWSDGHKQRSSPSMLGAVRIAPMHETAIAEVSGEAFRFAQIYIPRDALIAIDRPRLPAGASTAFRDPGFDSRDDVVFALVEALLDAGMDAGAALYRDHLALALLSHLDHVYGDRQHSLPAIGKLDARRLRIALERLHHAEHSPTLAELARLVGLSEHHFARSFRNATGMPPHAYLRALRMERAKRMLSTTSASITDVALDCGYGTPSAFATAFLRATGATPSQWRRRRTI